MKFGLTLVVVAFIRKGSLLPMTQALDAGENPFNIPVFLLGPLNCKSNYEDLENLEENKFEFVCTQEYEAADDAIIEGELSLFDGDCKDTKTGPPADATLTTGKISSKDVVSKIKFTTIPDDGTQFCLLTRIKTIDDLVMYWTAEVAEYHPLILKTGA